MHSRRKNLETRKPHNIKYLNILVSLFFIAVIAFIIYFIDPGTFGVIPFFLFLIFITVYFIIRKFSFAIAAVSFLILQYFRIGNIINLILIIAILIAYEFYTRKSN